MLASTSGEATEESTTPSGRFAKAASLGANTVCGLDTILQQTLYISSTRVTARHRLVKGLSKVCIVLACAPRPRSPSHRRVRAPGWSQPGAAARMGAALRAATADPLSRRLSPLHRGGRRPRRPHAARPRRRHLGRRGGTSSARERGAGARLWGRGAGPLALLACAPGEQHDISLLAFGLLLRSHGWRILFLGADTPISTLEAIAHLTAPAAIVLVAFDAALLESEATALRRLGRIAPLSLSGPGATADLPRLAHIRRLDRDLVAAADELARISND